MKPPRIATHVRPFSNGAVRYNPHGDQPGLASEQRICQAATFSGWKDSFFGDQHGQSMDAVEFFIQKEVVVERWPKNWSRKF